MESPDGGSPGTDRSPSGLRARLAIAALLTSGLFVAVLAPGGAVFLGNDDVEIIHHFDGRQTGTPEPRVILIGGLLARALCAAYEALPSLPWFPLFCYAVAWLSCTTILFLFLGTGPGRARGLALLAIAVTFVPFLLLRLSYTSVALVAGGAGSLVLLDAIRRRSTRWAPLLLSAGLLGVSYLLRRQIFPAQLQWMAPIALLAFRMRDARRTAVVAGLLVALASTNALVDRALYDGPAWRQYLEAFHLRFTLQETPRLEDSTGLRAAAAAAGWSPNDIALLQQFFVVDPALHDPQALAKIVAGTTGEHRDAASGIAFLEAYRLYLLALLTAWVIAWARMDRQSRQLAGAQLLLVASGVAYLLLFRRVPARVIVPLLLCASLFPLLSPAAARLPGRLGLGALLGPGAALAAVTSLVVGTMHAVELSTRGRARRQIFDASIAELGSHAAGRTLVAWPGALPYEHAAPLSRSPGSIGPNTLRLGWTYGSPRFDDVLRRLHLPHFPDDLVGRNDALLIAPEASGPLFVRYMRERRGRDVRLEVARELTALRPRRVNLYRVVDGAAASP
ncbi:MAG: hypothetical protein EXR72_12810 [Myxococcales bacterium]|nr:hypothetical protein [Myxococcales bacterium]